MENYELEYLVTDEELRSWMDSEVVRMGEKFEKFELTWERNEIEHFLMIYSNSKMPKEPYNDLSHYPFGRGLEIVEVADRDGFSLPVIQAAGRKLYYSLRKDYPVKRDFAQPKHW